MAYRAPDGRAFDEGDWPARAHELVFDALERGLRDTRFPVSSGEVVEQAGGEPVTDSPRIELREFLEQLPERRYANRDEIARDLNDRWTKAPHAP